MSIDAPLSPAAHTAHSTRTRAARSAGTRSTAPRPSRSRTARSDADDAQVARELLAALTTPEATVPTPVHTGAPVRIALDLSASGARRSPTRPGGARGLATELDSERLVDVVRSAVRGGIDLVAFDDDFRLQHQTVGDVRGRLDAAVVASRLAKVTQGVGLAATISTATTEVDHVITALETIARTSGDRAAWQTRPVAPAVAAAVRGATGVTVVVRTRTAEEAEEAATYADVVRVAAKDVATAADTRRRVRAAAEAAGRAADDVVVLVDLYAVTGPDRASAEARLSLLDDFEGEPVVAKHAHSITHVGTPVDLAHLIRTWVEAGAADGFAITPSSLLADVTGLVDGALPVLRETGALRGEYRADLRRTLGLPAATRA
jgi:alkanesulfonate monooxygenase SsuD/methylene tetrahydromethanopterin reductase-like flavin-dependent oxidoreductase (luciferase family)